LQARERHQGQRVLSSFPPLDSPDEGKDEQEREREAADKARELGPLPLMCRQSREPIHLQPGMAKSPLDNMRSVQKVGLDMLTPNRFAQSQTYLSLRALLP